MVCIVLLNDHTKYVIDTGDERIACDIVDYKLKNHNDCRTIIESKCLPNLQINVNSNYYNSSDKYDGKLLKPMPGWDYGVYKDSEVRKIG